MSQLARRDFLNGVALTVGGALLSPRDAFGLGLDDPARGRASYPPSLTGLRGSHAGSFEVAHALRDGSFWATAGAPSDTGESYDLVVVGAGISGLAAAWYFRQAAGPSARIPAMPKDFARARSKLVCAGRWPGPSPSKKPDP